MAFGEQAFELGIFDHAEGLVVALALLVLDDADLVGEILLGDRAEQMAHAVAFEEQRPLQRRARHGLEIIGAVEPGGAVEVGGADRAQVYSKYSPGAFSEPLNIRCSNRCAKPVRPAGSSFEPTLYQMLTATTGALRSSWTTTRRPLASVKVS